MIRQCCNWPGSLSDSVTLVEFYCSLFKVWSVPEVQKELSVLLSVGFIFSCFHVWNVLLVL